MSQFPLFTVVIPSYNSEGYLREAVLSALGQTYSHLEIIVVDDGSRHDQSTAIRDIADSRLRFLRQPNAGAAAARNAGVRIGTGEFIAFLDADDRWLPHKLNVQHHIVRSEGAGIVFSDLHRFRGNIRLDETYLGSLTLPERDNCFRGLVRKNFVPLSTAVVSRVAFESVGGFCPDPGIWEDWDLWLRLARHHRFSHSREVLAEYRLHDSNSSGDIDILTRRSLGTLSRLEQAHPELFADAWSDLQYSRASLWFDLGYAHLARGDRRGARRALRTAIRTRWTHRQSWKAMLRTLVPLPVREG